MEKDKTCKTPRWRMLKSQLNNLSSEEFATVIKKTDNAVILDVRTQKEFQMGHIPNAINFDYLAEDFLDKIEMLDKEQNYLIYCRSGRRSIRVCTWMRNWGFDNHRVFNLDNGFNEWIQQFPKQVTVSQ